MKKNKKFFLRIIAVLCVMMLFAGVLFLIHHFEDQKYRNVALNDPYADDDGVSRIFYKGAAYVPKEGIEAVLLIGIDDRGVQEITENNTNHSQADFLMLILINHNEQTYESIHINRDTMTEIPVIGVTGEYAGTKTAQLALAHTYGSGGKDSCQYTVDAVSQMMYGLAIDHYAAVTMDSIGIINDAIGGTEVLIEDDMTSLDPDMKAGATLKLNAEQAEYFVRNRQNLDDSTNISRMKRQRTFLSAWQEKATNLIQTDAEFALNLVLDLSDYLTTDMTVNELSNFASQLSEYRNNGIEDIEGMAVKGNTYMEFYIDSDDLKQKLISFCYTEAEP